ncbi:hypothetical protein N7510_003497 [Penicillium lagena]|uniref:uncharacterized protein n=1 Tax=Penicillium lagena TaxID=94218 RepID=UPI002541075E|nr:uncharacterized protein N7510_003497 [Penicillium lagena]KAJ5619513.1 hypothetical protein N7510_003497 [Penicillium lagena]
MSGPGDDRWRGGPSRQSSQRQNRGGQGGQRGGNAAWSGSGPAQEQHVPVRGFNAAETKNALKRGEERSTRRTSGTRGLTMLSFAIDIGPGEPKATFYKPTGKDSNNQRSGGPWGSKANTMANGKDFFVELRKQVAILQRGGTPAGG